MCEHVCFLFMLSFVCVHVRVLFSVVVAFVCACVWGGLMSTPPRGGHGNVFDGKTLTVRTGRFDQLTDSP